MYDGPDRRNNDVVVSRLDYLIDNQKKIKDQVEKTNGRVTALEQFMWAAKGVIAIIVIFLLPIIFSAFQTWLNGLK